MTYDEIFTLLSRIADAKRGMLADIPDTSADLRLTGDTPGTIGAILKNGTAVITKGSSGSPEATVTLSCDDFARLLSGKLNPMTAVFTGRIKVSGDYTKIMSIIKILKN